MRIGSPKEVMPGEARVAMTPESAAQLQNWDMSVSLKAAPGCSLVSLILTTSGRRNGVDSAKNYLTPLTLSPRCGHLWIPKSKG